VVTLDLEAAIWKFRSRVALQVVRLAKLGLNRGLSTKASKGAIGFHGLSSNGE
jgi:hypothetical protein